jgi:hypothetical protein
LLVGKYNADVSIVNRNGRDADSAMESSDELELREFVFAKYDGEEYGSDYLGSEDDL